MGPPDGAQFPDASNKLITGGGQKGPMPLTLQLVNETTLPGGGPVSFQLSGKCAIDIGRAAHLDWTLPDPTRFISNKHCEIRYKDGGYWLRDVSTNGTYLNGADHRMQAPHRLRNGDRFTVGHYLVAVTLEGAEEAADQTHGAAVPRRRTFRMIRICGRTKEMFRRPSAPSRSGRRGKTPRLIGRRIFQIHFGSR